jgi:hypothetical protein
MKIFLIGAFMCLCDANAFASSGEGASEHSYSSIIRFQMENDRFNGTDDGHTSAFRLFFKWPKIRPDISISINYENLTRREANSRLDLLGIDAAFGYPVWKGGRIAFSGGVAVQGDLGGQTLQNAFHSWLNEPELHLDYPDSYLFGLTAGTEIEQELANIEAFRLVGSGDARLASSAAPSWTRGALYLERPFILFSKIRIDPQFGISVYTHFWLSQALSPYYGNGYSLNPRLDIGWKRLAINAFYHTNPYGNDQGILGVGIGCRF